jgi:hypothetical protein
MILAKRLPLCMKVSQSVTSLTQVKYSTTSLGIAALGCCRVGLRKR